MTRSPFSTTNLNHLQRQLTGWRQRQLGRVRLPEAVWKLDAAVARSRGASPVSRTLRLNGGRAGGFPQWHRRARELCRRALGADPFAGALIVFRSRSRRALKLPVYERQGFWLCPKRPSQGRFAWWPEGTSRTARMHPHQ